VVGGFTAFVGFLARPFEFDENSAAEIFKKIALGNPEKSS
jgi:hypothetical protein